MLLPIAFVVLAIILGTAAWASFSAAPWVPTFAKDYARILQAAKLQPHDVVFELGAGDGRMLLQFAPSPAQRILGFELSIVPYLVAKVRIRKFHPRVDVRMQNFFNVNFRDATVIFCFLTPPAMVKLRPKLERECAPGTRILSYTFAIPGWQPTHVDKPQPGAVPLYSYTR